jgi:signal peptidase II
MQGILGRARYFCGLDIALAFAVPFIGLRRRSGFIIWIVAASKQIDSYLLVGLSFFFGGATGNLVDRLRFGEVIDFVDVYVRSFHWPAFNVADASLCVGTAVLFLHFLLRKDRT